MPKPLPNCNSPRHECLFSDCLPASDGPCSDAPASAFDGQAEKPQAKANCTYVCALPVHFAPVCHLYYQDRLLGVRNGVNHAVASLPHSVLFLCGKLFAA